ncbi:Kynurenine formamidase [Candidatus Burkholderia verschuerenii]|uniref:Kynurenine formamidase n=1 Tax=Candidatus Burkholderia verschuerenii TaxID=242163 RepID=A0A0L0MFP4_9BURK|nr:hypothetical protein [Candidatus Burkholderia verschuerenii]KND61143.1 Kynurenine formamidase [Candidatus Burkholderia verschuerenii]
MAWRQKNRWFKRWLVTITFWLVPVMIVAMNEVRDEMAYNSDDLEKSLSTWDMTDAQRAAGAASRCYGAPETARAAGCPADVLAANERKHQEAIDEYAHRKATLADYLWHAFVGYWIVPAIFLLFVGMLIGGIRRALRRPERPSSAAPSPSTKVKTTSHP